MIEWNPTDRYHREGRPRFKKGTEDAVHKFQTTIATCPPFSFLGYASEYDLHIHSLNRSKKGTPTGSNLDHHISIATIEEQICNYLNGGSILEFLNFVGDVVTPTWLILSASVYQMDSRALVEWTVASIRKFQLAAAKFARCTPKTITKIANALAAELNSAWVNLRFGHSTTNISIGNAVDARVAHGYSLDPVRWFESLWAWRTGRPVYAAETAAFLNRNYAVLGKGAHVAERDATSTVGAAQGWTPGAVAMSESRTQVATTKTNPYNDVNGAANPVLGWARRNPPLPILKSYSWVRLDTTIFVLFWAAIAYLLSESLLFD